jgi:hypothetical protein
MPNYGANGTAQLLRRNSQVFLWQNEAVAATQLSVAYQMERVDGAFYPWGFAVEVQFAAAPGAFELDIMGAETDAGFPSPGNYVKIGSITAVNASNVGRFESTLLYPKFIAGLMLTLTNAVNVTAKVTR